MNDFLETQLVSELTTGVESHIEEFVQKIITKLPNLPLGILFYGSALRDIASDSILDFYIITDTAFDYPGSSLAKLANTVLPPNVCYVEEVVQTGLMRGKLAFISYRQFLERSYLHSMDTTIWARFTQPVRLVWVRDTKSADKILEALRCSVVTASCWAALLGPESGTADMYWHNLFARTYQAELRVEKKGRSHNILQGQEERYRDFLLAAWEQAGIRAPFSDGSYHPVLTRKSKERAGRRWSRIGIWGKMLNVTRLLKASFTFSGGVRYLLWKIRRHTGRDIRVSSFEHRHPILSLPFFLWHLRKWRG